MWRGKSGRCGMKFDQYLSGMVELKMPARYTENILRLLMDAGIFVYQVQRKENWVTLSIHLDDFFDAKRLLRQHRYPFRIQKKYGLPFVISRIKRRRGLWLGLCTGFAVFYMLMSFIWGYEVTGNAAYSEEHLIALVQEYGMVPGSHRNKFDYDELASQITLDHPEFTWIQLEPRGTTLLIRVKERLPDTSGIHKEGSLVARADGRVTELLVFRGTPLVKQGDWVREGQVLVGGWDYPDRIRNSNGEFEPAGEPFAVEAQAVISGEQEHRVMGSCALEERILTATGREKKQVSLIWKGHQVIIWGPKESPYRYARQHVEKHSLFQWENFTLPIYLQTTIFTEKEIQEKQYTCQQAYETALERARKKLQEQMPDGSRFIHESIGISKTGKNMVQVEAVWLVEENLAQLKQEALPEAMPENEGEKSALSKEEKIDETGQNERG